MKAQTAKDLVWLDVDGTSETGQPNTREEVMKTFGLAPLHRPYNYNYALFDALHELEMRRIWFFTAYTAVSEVSN